MSQSEKFQGRIGILGAGALGAFYGARLFRAGSDVAFLMRSDYEAVRDNGLEVRSFEGDFHIRPPVFRSAREMGPCDLLIIGLKSTDNAALPPMLEAAAHAGTLVMTLQNGLGNEEVVAAALGGDDAARERVLGGIAFLCSNRIAPGVIHHMDHGWIRLGELSGAANPRTHQIAAAFRAAGIRCEVYDELRKARWEKLVWNIPFNGLGVAAQANVEQVLATPELRCLARALMGEVLDAAAADEVPLDPTLPDRMIKNSETMGPYRSSMQIDHEQGRRLEVEAILGEPVRRAAAGGATTPKLNMLYQLVSWADHRNATGAAP